MPLCSEPILSLLVELWDGSRVVSTSAKLITHSVKRKYLDSDLGRKSKMAARCWLNSPANFRPVAFERAPLSSSPDCRHNWFLPACHAHYLTRVSLMSGLEAAKSTLLLSSRAPGTRRFPEWASLWQQRAAERSARRVCVNINSLPKECWRAFTCFSL